MQELKYFRDGATLVISLDGLNWISKRRCSDKGMEKRNEELQPRISSGEMIQADEELQVITCILDQRGSAASPFWGNADCRSGIAARPSPSSTTPPRCCLPEEPHRSTLSSAASSLSGRPPEAPWTRVVFNARDIFSLIKNNSNIVTLQPDSVTMDRHDRLIIFCDEDLPLQRFGDICYTEDCRTSTGWHIDDNNALSAANSPNTNNANGNQLAIRDNFNNLSRLKSCPSYDPGVLSGSDPKGKKRKSVSFEDDVMVYLFDQESPTLELHSEADTSLPDVPLEDSGLEWEDDFSALEKNCHFQCVTHSQQHTHSAALSRRFFLSQSCLFLTHVTESDLEL
ncbi:uncharacterized protein LOC117748698 isoform X3 [Cyclopterus lumpus]|uniref:uncharacterized protein LOC117748698 isoform X3 n=1 Tax=Cyclopterus lumpus TaxID=8103 RepID=UPI001486F326|nr:uncharacterized protein LOC117748698 isoform X3 [Cyclopterus lumpus]